MKSMVSSLSFSKTSEHYENSSEAIIPIQDDGIITFSCFFSKENVHVRGGRQKYSLSVVFEEKDCLKIYKKANRLSVVFENLSRLFLIHLKERTELPLEFAEKIRQIFSESLDLISKKDTTEKIAFSVTCPICTSKSIVNLRQNIDGLKVIEHTIRKGDICSHQSQVYLNSDLEILGNKQAEIDIKKLKDSISNFRTPYDSLLERKVTEQEI